MTDIITDEQYWLYCLESPNHFWILFTQTDSFDCHALMKFTWSSDKFLINRSYN